MASASAPAAVRGGESALPELAAVPWRAREDARALVRRRRMWAAWTFAHSAPFVGAAALLTALEPMSFPVALAALAHAWAIPELYAARGVNVVRPKGPVGVRAEAVAQGLLGDLLGHGPRDLQRRSGLALERGQLGTWLVAEAGALLVAPGGRTVHAYCVRATDRSLPPSDRIAHLLLALRTDEQGLSLIHI